MFVILTYDLDAARTKKALKICRKYLSHVQKSVFEGTISPGALERLKSELKKVVVPAKDSVRIYKFESLKYSSKDVIGVNRDNGSVL